MGCIIELLQPVHPLRRLLAVRDVEVPFAHLLPMPESES